jgi:hypothetical protein
MAILYELLYVFYKIKINWDRIDKSKYQEPVEVSLANQDVPDNIDNLKSKRDVEEKLTKVSEVFKKLSSGMYPWKKEKEQIWQILRLVPDIWICLSCPN